MRQSLKTLAAATGLCLASLGAVQASPYDEFAGTTLVVNFPAHPHYNAVMKVLPEFTKETGIEVEVDQLPYLKMRERQTLELAQEDGDYDLIAKVYVPPGDDIGVFVNEGLADIDGIDRTLTTITFKALHAGGT